MGMKKLLGAVIFVALAGCFTDYDIGGGRFLGEDNEDGDGKTWVTFENRAEEEYAPIYGSRLISNNGMTVP
jgi:hypothetical protein